MEIAMKALWIVPLLTGAMLVAAPIMAKDNAAPATSGNRGQIGTANAEAAANQPFVASGADLKGPPQRFPAGQTPE
jgi:hypothetical protein